MVLLADDPLFLEHVAPPDHPERGERVLAVRAGLEAALRAAGPEHTYTRLPLRDVTDDQLARVHTPQYVEQLGHLAGRSGYLDADTFLSPGSVAAARRAAGGAVALVDAFARGDDRLGFVLPRPPGHHALSDRAMGFCLLNNVAVAAAHARASGYERVLVLDWDVHHGNGTQAMFFDDPSVLFISLHQFPNYPGTGAIAEQGSAEGRGYTVNLPLPKGGTDAVYQAAFERIVLPIVEQFRPSLALVSCGFDAHERDPLAEMRLTSEGYGAMTASLLGALEATCPLGIVLEGGYDLEGLEESSRAVASTLFVGARDAGGARAMHDARSASLLPEHALALAEVARAQEPHWKLG